MNRKIIIAGNTDNLIGVPIDIENYKSFFKSTWGGCFEEQEIDTSLVNATKSTFISKLKDIKKQVLDYFIFVFTGHGFSGSNDITGIEINKDGETIFESEINSVATRQLNIFDCCRNTIPDEFTKVSALRCESFSAVPPRELIKKIFNKRIMDAKSQNISLYACEAGEAALDTAQGGMFSRNLLICAKNNIQCGEFKGIQTLFNETRQNTIVASGGRQHPDCIIPRYKESESLIFSYNPNLNI